jgi:hypothetical protein
MLACDESASMPWARVVRGIASMLSALIFLAAYFSTDAGSPSGARKASSV